MCHASGWPGAQHTSPGQTVSSCLGEGGEGGRSRGLSPWAPNWEAQGPERWALSPRRCLSLQTLVGSGVTWAGLVPGTSGHLPRSRPGRHCSALSPREESRRVQTLNALGFQFHPQTDTWGPCAAPNPITYDGSALHQFAFQGLLGTARSAKHHGSRCAR